MRQASGPPFTKVYDVGKKEVICCNSWQGVGWGAMVVESFALDAMQTQVTFERVIQIAMRDLMGADDPALVDAAELDRRVACAVRDLPNWPVVIETVGAEQVAACLFDQPTSAFTGQVARYGLIGRTRRGGKFFKNGQAFWARKAGSTVNDATHHKLYSEALNAAY